MKSSLIAFALCSLFGAAAARTDDAFSVVDPYFDVTLDDLVVECFMPADDETDRRARESALQAVPPPGAAQHVSPDLSS